MPRRTLIFCLIGLIFLCLTHTCLGITNCNETGGALTVQECTAADFTSGSCTLQCTVTFSGTIFTLADARWIYFAIDPSSNVTLFDSTTANKTAPTSTSLALNEYYSGIYQCQMDYVYRNSSGDFSCCAYHDFNVSQAEGVALGDPCKSTSDCQAIGAACDTTCQCVTPNDIEDPPSACLSASKPNATCNINDQCSLADGYFCKNYYCKCNGTEKLVQNISATLCLYPTKPKEICTYEEQCTLFDTHTSCIDGFCTCLSPYTDGLDEKSYCKKPFELSDGDIAAIVVAGVFALGVVAIVIRCIAEACCCKGDKKKIDDEEGEH